MAQQMQQLSTLLFALLLLASNLVTAVEVEDLYIADVSAELPQRQWQHNALAQVITRLTGVSDFAAYPAITRELNNAGRYVKQFESQRQNGNNRLKVLLDASLINPLLQQQGMAVWGPHRPEILIWIVQQQAGDRRFLRNADDEQVSLLLQSLKQHGIPITVPLYDMDDLLLVTETDVWAGFWQPINQASVRYRPDMLMTVALDEVSRSGTTLQRLSWQRQSQVPGTNQTRVVRNEVTASDSAGLVKAFSTSLTGELATEQAVTLLAETQTYQLAITNMHSLADVVAVERLLGRVLGVASVTLSHFSVEQAQFTIALQISLAQLHGILQWEPTLTLNGNANGDTTSLSQEAAFSAANIPLKLAAAQADASYRFTRR